MNLLDHDNLLRECFECARLHPFYKGSYREDHDYRSAPPLEKAALLLALHEFKPTQEDHGVYLVRSGGSTHRPLIFPVDIAENNAQRAALARALCADGVFGSKTVALNLFGYSDLYRSAAILDDLLERCDATTLAMSAHARSEDVYAMAQHFSPTHILGTPSRLDLFANFLNTNDQCLQIPDLLYAGEVLRPSTLSLLQHRLGIQRIWSLYGAAETGIWAWSIAGSPPGWFSILPGVVVEILSPDAEGYGSIAVTNGFRHRFPVFRYRLGDVGRLVSHEGKVFLELRGRDNRSFKFDELIFDLEPIVALAECAGSVQLQLRSSGNGRDQLVMLMAADASHPLNESMCNNILASLTEIFRLSKGSDAVQVRIVEKPAMHIDPITAKTPILVDLRQ